MNDHPRGPEYAHATVASIGCSQCPVDLCNEVTYWDGMPDEDICHLWLKAGHGCSTRWKDVCTNNLPAKWWDGPDSNAKPLSSTGCEQCAEHGSGGGSGYECKTEPACIRFYGDEDKSPSDCASPFTFRPSHQPTHISDVKFDCFMTDNDLRAHAPPSVIAACPGELSACPATCSSVGGQGWYPILWCNDNGGGDADDGDPCAVVCPTGSCDSHADANKPDCADCVACHTHTVERLFEVSPQPIAQGAGKAYCLAEYGGRLAAVYNAGELAAARGAIQAAGVEKAITAAQSDGNGWTWHGEETWDAAGFPLNTGRVIDQVAGLFGHIYSLHKTDDDFVWDADGELEEHRVLCRRNPPPAPSPSPDGTGYGYGYGYGYGKQQNHALRGLFADDYTTVHRPRFNELQEELAKADDGAVRTVDLVVARYQEDSSWLADVERELPMVRIFVYEKGGGETICHTLRLKSAICVPLANVGRESHSFMTHLIEHHDQLADKVVFAQAGPPGYGFIAGQEGGHLMPGSDFFYDYLSPLTPPRIVFTMAYATLASRELLIRRNGYPMNEPHAVATETSVPDVCSGDWLTINNSSNRFWDAIHPRKPEIDLPNQLAYWHAHLEPQLGPMTDAFMPFANGAIASASGAQLAARPKAFYEQLRRTVGIGDTPDATLFLELAWAYVVGHADAAHACAKQIAAHVEVGSAVQNL
jgi:hypothetical protein